METRSTVFTILVIFAITCILCVISNQNATRNSNWGVRVKQLHTLTLTKTIPKSVKTKSHGSRLSTHTNNTVNLITPLFWDNVEGAYMITLRVGQSDVEFVLDTGSSQLSAKGAGCQWQNCTGASCTTVACPCGFNTDGNPRSDCRLHYYIPTGKALNPGEGGAGTSTTLKYGSQEDTVSHFDDSVALRQHHLVTCKDLLTQIPSTIPVTTQSYQTLGNLVVHRVSRIQGSSSSNLLGLSRPPDTVAAESGRVVIEKLFGGRQSIWNLILRPTEGWFTSGPPPSCFTNVKYTPLVNPSEFNLFLTKFYIVPILSISVGNATKQNMVKLPRSKTPKFCLIDTGTTLTYGSTRLGYAMRQAGWSERHSLWEIEFGNNKEYVKITYSADQLIDPENTQQSVLQVDPGRTLDDFDDIFPLDSCLLFGVLMMQNMMWCFDLDNNRLGVQALPSLV